MMFTEKTFQVFELEGLDTRMTGIRTEIQPIFQEIMAYVEQEIQPIIHRELYTHIAQHRRRTVYAPESTWAALSTQKRGYKMEAHLQLGIWPDYVCMWLSIIDQPKAKEEMAQLLVAHPEWVAALPVDFVYSPDHTQPAYFPIETVQPAIDRLANVKKSELQIGRVIPKESQLWQNPEAARQWIVDTYQQLIPLYQQLNRFV